MKNAKRLLLLGTGSAQRDLAEACRKRGITVYGVSNVDHGAAHGMLDGFARIDIADVALCTEHAKRLCVDAVYSVGSDIAMPTACAVSETLGLPHFVDACTAITCNDKARLRERLGTAFRGNIPFQIIQADDTTAHPFCLPCMVKPVDSQGQRGVCQVDDMAGFEQGRAPSLSFSRSGRIIVEPVCVGPEVSVNGYILNGRVVFAAVSDRMTHQHLPGGIPRAHHFPAETVAQEHVGTVVAVAEEAISLLAIRNGPVYLQCIVANDMTRIIEVTPRLDGCHMWHLLHASLGVNLLDLTLSHLLGNTPAQTAFTPLWRKPHELTFFSQPPGTPFKKDARATATYPVVRWYFNEGDIVPTVNGLLEKTGYCIAECR